MTDLSKEQAMRWVAREVASLGAYDEIMDRVEAERLLLRQNEGANAERFPMTATARRVLVLRLEGRLSELRKRLH